MDLPKNEIRSSEWPDLGRQELRAIRAFWLLTIAALLACLPAFLSHTHKEPQASIGIAAPH